MLAIEARTCPASGQALSFIIYRDHPSERIEVGESVQLFDFDPHKVFWFGAPGAQRRFVRREVGHGIPTRLEELTGAPKASSPEEVPITRVWLAEPGNFVLKLEGADKDGRPAPVLEVKRFTAETPAPGLQRQPPDCAAADSEMDDSGTVRAHLEATIRTGAGVNLGGQTTSGSGSVSMQTGKAPPASAGAITAVTLRAVEREHPGPCGRRLEVTGAVTTDGPATVWYCFYASEGGVEFSGGQRGTIRIDAAGSACRVKDATFPANRQGELRLQAAVQGANGRQGR